MEYVIFHNPRCSKSREGLKLLQDEFNDDDIKIVEYLKTPPTESEFRKVLAKLNLTADKLLRKNEKIYKEQFKNLQLNEDEWIKIMLENPKLIERPIVIKGNKAVIGRPPEVIKTLF